MEIDGGKDGQKLYKDLVALSDQQFLPQVSVCVVFEWCLCSVCVVFVWCLCSVCVVFVWCLCSVCVVFV